MSRHYYLQQMGIDIWVERKSDTIKQSNLMIITTSLNHPNERAWLLCEKMLQSIDVLSNDVIFHIIPDEYSQGAHQNLLQTIKEKSPKLILGFGDAALFCLFNESVDLDRMRTLRHHYHGIPLVVTYHPSNLLMNNLNKKKAYHNLLQVQEDLQ